MKKFLILFLLYIPFTAYSNSIGTDSLGYPRIGNACPDFKLENVEYFPKSTVNLSDFKGKWLILDFWTEYCVSCIESFPKLNAIQAEFKDNIQIILIGTPRDNPKKIRTLYETHRIQKNLNLPIAYDKQLSERFGVPSNPFIVIVDPKGVVQYLTYSFSKNDISELIKGGNPKLGRSYTKFDIRAQDSYDKETPLLLNNNGGHESNYFLRSIFTKYDEQQSLLFNIESRNRLEMLGFDLTSFYTMAYGGFIGTLFSTDVKKYGEIWPQLIFENVDTSIFKGDYINKENLFSYSADIGNKYFDNFGNKTFDFKHILRNDLEILFPYCASVQKRLMPCNILVISDDNLSKLKTKTSEYKFEWVGGKRAGFSATKMPISHLLNHISGSIEHPENIPLIYNGEDVFIDIDIKSTYYKERVEELKKFGFSIIRSEKLMDVIVVKNK